MFGMNALHNLLGILAGKASLTGQNTHFQESSESGFQVLLQQAQQITDTNVKTGEIPICIISQPTETGNKKEFGFLVRQIPQPDLSTDKNKNTDNRSTITQIVIFPADILPASTSATQKGTSPEPDSHRMLLQNVLSAVQEAIPELTDQPVEIEVQFQSNATESSPNTGTNDSIIRVIYYPEKSALLHSGQTVGQETTPPATNDNSTVKNNIADIPILSDNFKTEKSVTGEKQIFSHSMQTSEISFGDEKTIPLYQQEPEEETKDVRPTSTFDITFSTNSSNPATKPVKESKIKIRKSSSFTPEAQEKIILNPISQEMQAENLQNNSGSGLLSYHTKTDLFHKVVNTQVSNLGKMDIFDSLPVNDSRPVTPDHVSETGKSPNQIVTKPEIQTGTTNKPVIFSNYADIEKPQSNISGLVPQNNKQQKEMTVIEIIAKPKINSGSTDQKNKIPAFQQDNQELIHIELTSPTNSRVSNSQSLKKLVQTIQQFLEKFRNESESVPATSQPAHQISEFRNLHHLSKLAQNQLPKNNFEKTTGISRENPQSSGRIPFSKNKNPVVLKDYQSSLLRGMVGTITGNKEDYGSTISSLLQNDSNIPQLSLQEKPVTSRTTMSDTTNSQNNAFVKQMKVSSQPTQFSDLPSDSGLENASPLPINSEVKLGKAANPKPANLFKTLVLQDHTKEENFIPFEAKSSVPAMNKNYGFEKNTASFSKEGVTDARNLFDPLSFSDESGDKINNQTTQRVISENKAIAKDLMPNQVLQDQKESSSKFAKSMQLGKEYFDQSGLSGVTRIDGRTPSDNHEPVLKSHNKSHPVKANISDDIQLKSSVSVSSDKITSSPAKKPDSISELKDFSLPQKTSGKGTATIQHKILQQPVLKQESATAEKLDVSKSGRLQIIRKQSEPRPADNSRHSVSAKEKSSSFMPEENRIQISDSQQKESSAQTVSQSNNKEFIPASTEDKSRQKHSMIRQEKSTLHLSENNENGQPSDSQLTGKEKIPESSKNDHVKISIQHQKSKRLHGVQNTNQFAEKMQKKGHTDLSVKESRTDFIINPTHSKKTGQQISPQAQHPKSQSDNFPEFFKPEMYREGISLRDVQLSSATNDYVVQQSLKSNSLAEFQNQASMDMGSQHQSSLWQERKPNENFITDEKSTETLNGLETNPIKNFSSVTQKLHLKESTSGRSEQIQQVIREITRQISLKIDRKRADIQIRVMDENLGQLKVKLQIKEDVAKLLVITESDESRQILQKHAPQLKENLAQHGIRVEKFDFWTVQEKQEQIAGQMGQSHHQSMREREQHRSHSTSGGSTLRIAQAEAEEPLAVRKPRRSENNTLDVMV